MATHRLRPTLLVGLLCLVGAAGLGCASQLPWASAGTAPKQTAPAQQTPPAAAAAPSAPADSQQMQQIMAELQRLGTLDPAARDQLTADLQQTDPALWPGMLHQARAMAAYRQRAAYPPGTHPGPDAAPGVEPDGRWPHAMPAAGEHASGNPMRPDDPASPPIHRLPVPSQAALAPSGAPQQHYPATGFPHLETTPPSAGDAPAARETETVSEGQSDAPRAAAADTPPPKTPDPERKAEAQLTSYTAQSALDWSGHLDSAIGLLEDAKANSPEEEVRLRMLYLAAGRYDDAVRAISDLPAGEQEFWTAKFHGLGTLLDGARNPDAPSRKAEAKQVLAGAASKLGELAPLVVRNLAFCTRVHSYGCFETFPSYKFTPEQRVLLYAEVDNFASESTARGYHTSLKSSYQIFDARGQRVADEELASTEELCQNRRHDFFIVYDFHLPQRIYPGKHTLRLTIEDLKGRKIGESSIDLDIVAESGSPR